MSKIIFITGCSAGFGRALAEETLKRGYSLVATARKVETLSDLPDGNCLKLALDVTDEAQVQSAVEQAVAKFGRIDVLINNAGFGMTGTVEEVSDAEARQVFEANVFGLLTMTRAVLPLMRQQRSGHIINLSSVGGLTSLPGGGLYCATKFAVEGISEALAAEVAPLGIKVTLIEPGPFRTEFLGRSMQQSSRQIDDYEPVHEQRRQMTAKNGKQAGDPVRGAGAILDVVGMENPPLRLPLGNSTVDRLRKKIEQLQGTADEWESVARGADFPSGQ